MRSLQRAATLRGFSQQNLIGTLSVQQRKRSCLYSELPLWIRPDHASEIDILISEAARRTALRAIFGPFGLHSNHYAEHYSLVACDILEQLKR